MPKVPTLDAPQVAPNPLPGVRQSSIASSDDFGGKAAEQNMKLGGALTQAGTAVSNIAIKMQERENADRLFQAEQALKSDYLEIEKVARERTLSNAYGLTRESTEGLDKAAKKHSESLTNDAQRRIFDQTVSKLRLASVHSISTHESSETRKSLEASSVASQVGSIDVSAAAYGNPALVASGQADKVMQEVRRDITKRIEATAAMTGQGPEVTQFKINERMTQLHAQNIQAMVDRDPMAAAAYYEANKAEINGASRDVIERTLKVGTQRLTAQQFADEVKAKGMTQLDALALAREKYTGEERQMVVAEVNSQFQQDAAAVHAHKLKQANMGWDIYSKTGKSSAIPAEIWSAMDGRDRLQILDMERRQTELAGKPDREPRTNWDIYTQLHTYIQQNPKASTPDKLDLRRYYSELHPTQRGILLNLQKAAGNEKEMKDVATLQQQLNSMHYDMKWGSSKEDNQKKGQLDAAVRNAIDVAQADGKRLNFDERKKIIDRFIMEGELRGQGFLGTSPNKRFYEVAGTEDEAKFAPNIPDAERKQIEAALKRSGRNLKGQALEDEILQVYRADKGLYGRE